MTTETRKNLRPPHATGDACLETQTLQDLHALLTRPGRRGMSVGEMVGVAAQIGLLDPRPRVSAAYDPVADDLP